MTNSVINDSPTLRLGEYPEVITETEAAAAAAAVATTAETRVTNLRTIPAATVATDCTQSGPSTSHRRRYIKTKVSIVSSTTSSKPFLNGAIISLVIYSLYQILASNLANVLNNNDAPLVTTPASRCVPMSSRQTGNIFKQQLRTSNIGLSQDRLLLLSPLSYHDKASCILTHETLAKLQDSDKKYTSSPTELVSHEETVTSSENKQQCQNNNDDDDAVRRSSSLERTMIYEVPYLLSQLVQNTQRNFYKIVCDVSSQLRLLLHHHHHHHHHHGRSSASPSSFGGVLFAQAAQVAATTPTFKSSATNDQSKNQTTIINLNITNFNTELIQDRHPFPHIKLIEYYLPHCGICRKFKSTYVQLAKEIFLWRNVIRPSAIDISEPSNSPIAKSWSIEEVPILRVHPPPNEALSKTLQSQYTTWKNEQKLEPTKLQEEMYREYYSGLSMPVVPLKVTKYTNDNGSGLLSADLLDIVHTYTENYPTQLPKTWPNFKPVTETTLKDLMRGHTRPELFLLIERKSPAELSVQSNGKSNKVSLGFRTVMDLSASPAHKAIRYMYASENEALLKEIISYADRQYSTLETRSAIETLSSLLKKSSQEANASTNQQNPTDLDNSNSGSSDGSSSSSGTDSSNGNNELVLVHVDLTHQNNNTLLSSIYPIPFVHIVTPTDLIKFEAQHNAQTSSPLQNNRRGPDSSISRLSRRSLLLNSNEQTGAADEATNASDDDVGRRQQHQSKQQQQLFMQLSPEERIRLLTLYVNEIYTPQPEDKAFVEALAKFDESPTSDENKLEALKLSRRTYVDATHGTSAGSIIGEHVKAISRLFKAATTQATTISATTDSNNNLTDNGRSSNTTPTTTPTSMIANDSISANLGSCRKGASDYNDKLKAIRYSLFNEVPRRLMNPSDNKEKIRTLLDLITIIKHYFPLPDSASIQFIDGVHRFLSKYQYQTLPLSDQYAAHVQGAATTTLREGTSGIELNAQTFKRELKRLESEGKRLPEIQEWSYCGSSGYACGLWRLFHTLTAFEYKKLSQISSPQTQQLHQQVASAQHLSKGSNHQQRSEYLYVNVANESRQSQQLQQLQKHQQQLVKLTPASQTSSPTATTAAAVAAAGTASSVKLADKSSSIQSRNITATAPNNTAMISAEVTMPSPVERLVSPPASSTSLSLTIATPTSSTGRRWSTSSSDVLTATNAELPTPVLLVMRDYVTNYFSCEDCAKNFRIETANLSLDRITQFEPPEFSVLWLWETHNRISKRLSVDNETNPQRPNNWFPSHEQCSQCYKRPPSYLNDPTADSTVIFRESVEWNRDEILRFLVAEYTKTPMDNGLDLFGYQVPPDFVWIVFITFVIFVIIIRCAACYIERQRRHKATTILNGNGVSYSTELQ